MTALSDRVVACHKDRGSVPHYVTPVSPVSDWTQIHDDCSQVMSDDQDAVTEEAAETDSRKLTLANGCTMVLIRAVYDSGETVPTIRVFGFDGSHKRAQNLNANPMNLPDSDGNIAITLAKLATDVKTEAGRLATEPVQVDVKGSSSIVALVASTGAGTAGVTLEAKVL